MHCISVLIIRIVLCLRADQIRISRPSLIFDLIMSKSGVNIHPGILGAWSLIHYYHHPISSPEDRTYPHGQDPTGMIMYTPTGHMSALVVRPGQPPFSDGAGISPLTSGTPADWETVGRNQIAYSGRFWTKGDRLWHELGVCSIPSQVGKVQERKVRFEDVDGEMYLELGVDEVLVQGVKRKVCVRWRKMGSNEGGIEGEEVSRLGE
jgi:hypothetical protein